MQNMNQSGAVKIFDTYALLSVPSEGLPEGTVLGVISMDLEESRFLGETPDGVIVSLHIDTAIPSSDCFTVTKAFGSFQEGERVFTFYDFEEGMETEKFHNFYGHFAELAATEVENHVDRVIE